MLTEAERLCVMLEGLMAEKQDLDVKIADTLCKVHRYLMEEGRGESAGWAEGDGPPRFQDDEEV